MASKKSIAGIIGGLLIVGVILGAVFMTVAPNNSDVVEPVEQNEQNEPVEPSQDEPVVTPGEQEEPEEKKDPVWEFSSSPATEPEEDKIGQIQSPIAIGRELVISGTAISYKGESVKVDVISNTQPINEAHEVATVDENGMWSVTIDTSDLNADDYTVTASIGANVLGSQDVKIVVGAPTVNTIPEQVSFGQDFIISGTAVGFTGETVKVEMFSKTHIFGVTKTATVDENGVWEVDASDVAADEYTVVVSLGVIAVGSQDVKIVMEQPTINTTPEEITIGQEITISGTAVSYKGKTIHVWAYSDHHTCEYDVEMVTTVKEDGTWSVSAGTEFFAEDTYYIYAYVEDIEVKHMKIRVPEQTMGQDVVISGTAVGLEGKYLTIDLWPETPSNSHGYQTSAVVGQDGSWSYTLRTSYLSEDIYHVFVYRGEIEVVEDGEITMDVKLEAPTVNEIPEEITIGDDLVFSGTAKGHEGELMCACVMSYNHGSDEDGYDEVIIDENGMWSITINTANFAEDDYNISIYILDGDEVAFIPFMHVNAPEVPQE